MAAIPLGRAPITQNVTIPNNSQAIEVVLGQKTARVTFLFVGQAGSYAFTGTEGQLLGTDQIPIVADSFFVQRVDMGVRDQSMFFQVTAGAPVTLRIISEPH
jgi:hypothetical protein